MDQNKEVVRRFVEQVLARGNLEAIDELLAPDFRSHTWPLGDDDRREALKAVTERVHASLRDVEFLVDELIGEEDRVVARLTSSATVVDEFMGIPAAGTRYTIEEVHFFVVRDGRIAEHRHLHDVAGLMRQLGADSAST